jgi:hypothetical protein
LPYGHAGTVVPQICGWIVIIKARNVSTRNSIINELGNHSLNVKIVREGKVSIVAIMVGPSDGPY